MLRAKTSQAETQNKRLRSILHQLKSKLKKIFLRLCSFLTPLLVPENYILIPTKGAQWTQLESPESLQTLNVNIQLMHSSMGHCH